MRFALAAGRVGVGRLTTPRSTTPPKRRSAKPTSTRPTKWSSRTAMPTSSWNTTNSPTWCVHCSLVFALAIKCRYFPWTARWRETGPARIQPHRRAQHLDRRSWRQSPARLRNLIPIIASHMTSLPCVEGVWLDTFLRFQVDHRTDKCMQPIKNQGTCGSCLTFSSLAPLEFSKCKQTGVAVALRYSTRSRC